MIEVHSVSTAEDLAYVRDLFREYSAGLGVDLCFQGFEDELATLPGKYAPPAGRLLLARRGAEALGCVALRPLKHGACEMKRLYVRPAARGEQLGRRLAERICQEAREAGYSRMCLDTLPSMEAAQKIYADLGFREIEPYVFNPVAGVKFLALALASFRKMQSP